MESPNDKPSKSKKRYIQLSNSLIHYNAVAITKSILTPKKFLNHNKVDQVVQV